MNDNAELAVKPISLTDIDIPQVAHYQLPKAQAIDLLAEFVASGGLIVGEDGEPTKMSIKDFAYEIGWAERTVYNWIDRDPDWNARVYKALKRVHSAKRVSRVIRGVFLKAAAGEAKQAELYLRHFWPDYKDPKFTQEHEVGQGLATLISAAKERTIINGEAVDNTERSGADTNLLPDGS